METLVRALTNTLYVELDASADPVERRRREFAALVVLAAVVLLVVFYSAR